MCVMDQGEVYSWGRGVNGQLGHGREADEHVPVRLDSLSTGGLSREALISTAQPMGGYVQPADRFAVVPEGTDDDHAVPDVPEDGCEPSPKKHKANGDQR